MTRSVHGPDLGADITATSMTFDPRLWDGTQWARRFPCRAWSRYVILTLIPPWVWC